MYSHFILKFLFSLLVITGSFSQEIICPSNGELTSEQIQIILISQCNVIEGELHVSGNQELQSLQGLENIHTIRGSIMIHSSQLTDLSGLSGLTTIEGEFHLHDNTLLQSLNGLESLTSVVNFMMMNNMLLENLDGLRSLTTVHGSLELMGNVNLQRIYGLNNVNTIQRFALLASPNVPCDDKCTEKIINQISQIATDWLSECEIAQDVCEITILTSANTSCSNCLTCSADSCSQTTSETVQQTSSSQETTSENEITTENEVTTTSSNPCNILIPCFNGQCIDDSCSCASGYEGYSCESFYDECSFNDLSNTETDFVPVLNQENSGFQNGNLLIEIKSPLVSNRLATSVKIGNSINEGCSYPQNNEYWLKSFVDCEDSWNADIPWTLASNCGWEIVSEKDFDVYSTFIKVTHYDEIDIFRGNLITRETEHIIPISVKFQTNINISTDIQVFSEENVLVAITKQSFDPQLSKGTLEITTNLQTPFVLRNPVISSGPSTLGLTLNEKSQSCNDVSSCFQVFEIEINPNTECTISGAYILNFNLECTSDCPVNQDETVQIGLNVNSEDFCNEIEIDVSLTASFEVFQDSNFNELKDDFFVDETPYFQINLISEANLISNNILNLYLKNTQTNEIFELFTESGNTPLGDVSALVFYRGNSNNIQFSFLLNDDINISFVNPDASVVFDLFINLEIIYENFENQNQNQYKRKVLQYSNIDTQSLDSSAHFIV